TTTRVGRTLLSAAFDVDVDFSPPKHNPCHLSFRTLRSREAARTVRNLLYLSITTTHAERTLLSAAFGLDSYESVAFTQCNPRRTFLGQDDIPTDDRRMS